ncbi:hypothetical protein, partial [Flavobacterium aurantiibacter]|uniref:hypothetical protein n=1 Tax=Flavobacterium aurantiibacter TaxID=2023067 RepID=UPI001A9C7A88
SNVLSQGIANSGDFTQINMIEALTSAVPGYGPTVLGETFSYTFNDFRKNKRNISTPESVDHALLQIGGGVISKRFGSAIDSSPLFKKGAPRIFGNIAAFGVETASNTAPLLGDKTSGN